MADPQQGRSAAKRAAGDAAQAGRRVANSKGFELLVTVGLVSYGVVHLLVAWIAVQIAWTGSGQEASQKGAFGELASTPVGDVLVWITAVGLSALALWQVFEAIWGHRDRAEGRKRLTKRLGSAGKAILYVVLGVSAVSTAVGAASSGSGSAEKTMTGRLMSVAFGRVLVVLIGVGVVVAGGRLVYRGLTKKFTHDLTGGVGPEVLRLGLVGYAAKGFALTIVGILFIVAAVTYDAQQAGGLDTALRTLRGQPYGAVLLTVLALGIACFGLYCFAWSRHFKKT